MTAKTRVLKIVRLPGDGIGPEIVDAAWRVMEVVADQEGFGLEASTADIGGAALDSVGVPLPAPTLEMCRAADALLLGAVGGPKWDDAPVRPERGLLDLRRGLLLYANLRPVKPIMEVARTASPLKTPFLEGVDVLVVRELTGGLYFSTPRGRKTIDGERAAIDTLEYRESEVRRVVNRAFRCAQGRKKKLTSVDKANVLESSRLWREIVNEMRCEYPDVEVEHQLVDSMAMRLITHAREYDVVVTTNMFGDILTDEAAVLGGSLGLLPSASIGDHGASLYEPVHGSAPDIAGQGIANPMATILSVALLLRHTAGAEAAAARVEDAVVAAIRDGRTTPDLGGQASTQQVTDAIIQNLQQK